MVVNHLARYDNRQVHYLRRSSLGALFDTIVLSICLISWGHPEGVRADCVLPTLAKLIGSRTCDPVSADVDTGANGAYLEGVIR